MDEAGIEKKGVAALKPELDRIAAIKTKAEIAGALAHSTTRRVGDLPFGAQPDFKNAKIHIAAVDQGGLALPDRDYYLKDEERFANVRKQYPGPRAEDARAARRRAGRRGPGAQAVLDIETALAKAALERVKRRDPANVYHKLQEGGAGGLAPGSTGTPTSPAAGPPPSPSSTCLADFFKGAKRGPGARKLDDVEDLPALARRPRRAPALPAAS
jgi:predicted metalloendopeptidase